MQSSVFSEIGGVCQAFSHIMTQKFFHKNIKKFLRCRWFSVILCAWPTPSLPSAPPLSATLLLDSLMMKLAKWFAYLSQREWSKFLLDNQKKILLFYTFHAIISSSWIHHLHLIPLMFPISLLFVSLIALIQIGQNGKSNSTTMEKPMSVSLVLVPFTLACCTMTKSSKRSLHKH